MDQLVALIVDESKWLTAAMGLALLAVATLLYRRRRSDLPVRVRVAAAMNLYFGITIGTMAFGHLLAVTTKLALGTLGGSTPAFYAIGIALAAPSWWLIHHAQRRLASDDNHERATLVLNTWLAITLLALGLHNLPLAAPAFFNIAYKLHSRRAVGWAIVCLAIVVNVGLFVGSLVFLASGQSFEQFRGIE
jgi:LPXTG-motif cell wall-anchored protein